MSGGVMDLVDYVQIDAIQHPRDDGLCRLPDDAENGDGDQQADDGIGKRDADPDSDAT